LENSKNKTLGKFFLAVGSIGMFYELIISPQIIGFGCFGGSPLNELLVLLSYIAIFITGIVLLK